MLLSGIAAAAARRVLRVQATTTARHARQTAASDALLTLTRHAGTADPAAGDLRAARDSALEIVRTVGSTTICRGHADTVVTTTGGDTVPWRTTLPRTITTDDQLRLWSDTEARWITRRIIDVRSAGGTCGDSTTSWPGHAGQHLVLDSAVSATPGSPVRVLARERWSEVRGADGQWSLALASWDATRHRFSAPQPLLTPLAAPSAETGAGLTVRAEDGRGHPVADSALRHAVALVVTLRTATSASAGVTTDSVRIDVRSH
jgi:hypothetical protein